LNVFIKNLNFFSTEERKTWTSWITWGWVNYQQLSACFPLISVCVLKWQIWLGWFEEQEVLWIKMMSLFTHLLAQEKVLSTLIKVDGDQELSSWMTCSLYSISSEVIWQLCVEMKFEQNSPMEKFDSCHYSLEWKILIWTFCSKQSYSFKRHTGEFWDLLWMFLTMLQYFSHKFPLNLYDFFTLF